MVPGCLILGLWRGTSPCFLTRWVVREKCNTLLDLGAEVGVRLPSEISLSHQPASNSPNKLR